MAGFFDILRKHKQDLEDALGEKETGTAKKETETPMSGEELDNKIAEYKKNYGTKDVMSGGTVDKAERDTIKNSLDSTTDTTTRDKIKETIPSRSGFKKMIK